MPSFADALRAINQCKDAGVILDYAVAGALAVAFWAEPIPTYDLDVLARLPAASGLHAWAEERHFPTKDEHILVAGVPTQFLPAPDALAEEVLALAKKRGFLAGDGLGATPAGPAVEVLPGPRQSWSAAVYQRRASAGNHDPSRGSEDELVQTRCPSVIMALRRLRRR